MKFNNKRFVLSSALVVLSSITHSSFAYMNNNEDGFFIGTELQLLTTDNNTDNDNDDATAVGGGVNVGYFFNPYIGLETSYSNSSDLLPDHRFEHYDVSILGNIPLSDVFSFYIGAGAANYDDQVLAKGQVGLSYRFSSNISWQAGYTYYSEPDNWNDNVQSFDIGVTYHFSQGGAEKKIIKSEPMLATLPVLVSEPKKIVTQIQCREVISTENYVVKTNDWLLKIAREHYMSAEDFYNLNTAFVKKLSNINIIQPGDIVNINISKRLCN